MLTPTLHCHSGLVAGVVGREGCWCYCTKAAECALATEDREPLHLRHGLGYETGPTPKWSKSGTPKPLTTQFRSCVRNTILIPALFEWRLVLHRYQAPGTEFPECA